jgi:hypothetical protein
MQSIQLFSYIIILQLLLLLRCYWPVSCERECSSLQREVSVPLQPGSDVFLLCKSLSHDTARAITSMCLSIAEFFMNKRTNYCKFDKIVCPALEVCVAFLKQPDVMPYRANFFVLGASPGSAGCFKKAT